MKMHLLLLYRKDILKEQLDVVKKEPIPSDSPLIKMDNVLLTSHIAGMSEDAVPKSPFLLMAELDRYFETGVTNRIVNEKDLEA